MYVSHSSVPPGIPAYRLVLGLFLLAIALPAAAGPNGGVSTKPQEGPATCIGCIIWDLNFCPIGATRTPAPTRGTPAVPGATPTPTRPPLSSGLGPDSALRAATIDTGLYLRLREESFLKTPAGRHFADLYDTHTREMSQIALTHPEAFDAASRFLTNWQPVFSSLLDGHGASTVITAGQVADLQHAFDVFESLGSPTLRAALERQEALLDVPGYVGLTADQAREKLESVAPPALVLPIATSVHGAGGSFFHSDARVLNPSDSSPVTVTARYRCVAAACAAAEETFTLGPGELRSFDDVVAGFFGAPESFGAIEFTGDVFVDSRIYTPARPSPTNGMYAPGQPMDEAYSESVLLALSHSANPSAGFRTNAGVYNGNDVALTVSFDLFDPSGALLGSVTRDVPARTTVQVNDVFTAAGVSGDVPAAYAVVRSDGVHELYAYAAVIDNLTQDPFLIRGRGNRAYENGAILPAVASVHGVGGTFFHSDVHVLNPSPDRSATVHVRYRCAGGACGNAEQTFTLAAREMRTFEDAVVTLFSAAETFGAVEFEGGVVVDSRLYTPSRPGPTTGMAVPGVRRQRADPEQYLPLLSHSSDLSRGFRSNVGVYNPGDSELTATITLYDSAGARLGDVVRAVPARSAVQVNDLFTSAGIAGDAENAYAVVRADGLHDLLAYAAVVDNQSQDPTFTLGRGRIRVPTAASARARAETVARTQWPRRAMLTGLGILAVASLVPFRRRR